MSKSKKRKCAYCDCLTTEPEKTPHGDWCCSTCFCENFEWCGVCQEYQGTDDPCRHIFWTENGYMGVGGYEHDWPHHKDSFMAVLRKTKLAHELRVGIENGTLRTGYHGPIIGSISYDCSLQLPGMEFRSHLGNLFTDDLTQDDEEAMTLGVGWLDSIADDDARKEMPGAIALTLAWIDEWEVAKRRHQEIMWFHGQHAFHRAAVDSLAIRRQATRIVEHKGEAWLSNCGRYVGWYEPSSESSVNPVVTDGCRFWRWSSKTPLHIGSWRNRGDRNFDISLYTGERRETVVFDRRIESYTVPAELIA